MKCFWFLLILCHTLFALDETVTSNLDDSSGGTLREAIVAINSAAESTNNIDFNLPGSTTITLGSSLLIPTKELTIDGTNGGNTVTVDGDNSYQIFVGLVSIDFTLQNINFSNASSNIFGGVVGSNNSVTISNGTFTTCSVTPASGDAFGGAILGDTITLTGTNSFSGCLATSASGNAFGGAIYGNSTTTLTGTNSFSGCFVTSASGDAFGGAILGAGPITLTDTNSFSDCFATAASDEARGGAILGNSTITLTGTNSFSDCFVKSISKNALGGAIFGIDTITLTGTNSFSGCFATAASEDAAGGAILGDTITLTGTNSFSGCFATSASGNALGGAIGGNSTIAISDGTFTNCSAEGNSEARGGAIYGTGPLTLTGTNSFSGCSATSTAGTAKGGAIYVVSGGTLEIKGPTTFSGNQATQGKDIFMESGASFLFDTDANVTVPNPIESDQSGPSGTFVKNGTGKLSLNGDNTYDTTDTTVNLGELNINGSVITPVIVDGGTLSGNLTINDSLTNNGGTVSPGNSAGTIHVTDNFTQNSGGTLEVDITPAPDSDRLFIQADTADVDGTLLVNIGNGNYLKGTVYKIIEGTTIIRPTLQVQKTGPLANLVQIEIVPGSIQLVINNTVIFACQSLPKGNPQMMVDALNALNLTAASPMAPLVTALGFLNCPQPLGNVLNTMTAANYANLEWMALTADTQLSYILGSRTPCLKCTSCGNNSSPSKKNKNNGSHFSARMQNQRDSWQHKSDGNTQVNEYENRHTRGAWVQVFGNYDDTNNFDWLSGYDANTGGFMVGFDLCTSPYYIGVGTGYTHTDFHLHQNAGYGDVYSLFGAIYGGIVFKYVVADASVIVGGKHFNMHRTVVFLNIDEKACAKWDSPFVNAHLGLLGKWRFSDYCWQLFGNLDYHYLYLGSVLETGNIKLLINSHHSNFLKAELGTQAKGIFKHKNVCWVPYVGVSGIVKTPLGSTNYGAFFVGSSFFQNTQTSNDAQLLISPRAGLRVHMKSFNVFVGYKGEFNQYTNDHQVDGGVEWTF
ncbi:MAG: Extracellular serine protease [Chlamydiae bacterium]|nr:Extracellular serine protease [Chlamydiota bacterium]